MDAGYLKNRKEEALEVRKTSFWQDFIKKIEELRDDAVNRCIKNSNIDAIRQNQGKVEVIDRILAIPTDLWNEKQGTTE